MRGSTAFLFLFVIAASAAQHSQSADNDFMIKQRNLYYLFYHIYQPNANQEQIKIGREFSIESNMNKYSDSQVVTHFLHKYKEGMLPKGRIFSVTNYDLVLEAKALFELLYHAKDYETFYNTACWAREHINEYMFVYTLNTAIVHRPDCFGLKLPPLYEILPHYYFNSEVIEKAQHIKMQEHGKHVASNVHTLENKAVVIDSNYSGWYINYNEEQKLSYFTEDIELNSMYYYFNIEFPYWMNGEKYGLKNYKRGEVFYFVHQQILSRYYMERLSNGMGLIPKFSWHWPVKTGFYPSMKYPNGLSYPVRPNHYDLKKSENLRHLTEVEDYERRIRDAIDHGYIIKEDGSHYDIRGPEGIEHIANIIQGNNDTLNWRTYRRSIYLSKILLGNSIKPTDKYHIAPSALENFETCFRDPMFFQLYERYVGYFTQYKSLLTPYTKEELSFPGVKIVNVDVGKLITFFNKFDTEITNVAWQSHDEVSKMKDNTKIWVHQYRLNHKPFTVTINTVSDKETDVYIRIFLGPKLNNNGKVFKLNENRLNFCELDHFMYTMKSGKNTIERSSKLFWNWWTSESWTTPRHHFKRVLESSSATEEYNFDEINPEYPQRIMLPKGRRGGMPFYLYVIITPHLPPTLPEGLDHSNMGKVGSATRPVDSRSLGYPFDRLIEHEHYFKSLSNMHFENVLIFHEKESNISKD